MVGRHSRAATCRARLETPCRPMPLGTRLRGRRTQAPMFRARTVRRTRRSGPSSSARPSPTDRSLVVLPVVGLFVDAAVRLLFGRFGALDELTQLDRVF